MKSHRWQGLGKGMGVGVYIYPFTHALCSQSQMPHSGWVRFHTEQKGWKDSEKSWLIPDCVSGWNRGVGAGGAGVGWHSEMPLPALLTPTGSWSLCTQDRLGQLIEPFSEESFLVIKEIKLKCNYTPWGWETADSVLPNFSRVTKSL